MKLAKRLLAATVPALLLTLSACTRQKEDLCTSEDAKSLVASTIKDEIVRQVPDKIKSVAADQNITIGRLSIREMVDAISIVVTDIRTNGNINNSSKISCSASLAVKIPVSILNSADAERKENSQNLISEMADAEDIKSEEDAYISQINYSVQKTDDNSKIFTEVDNVNKIYDLTAEIVADDIIKPAVDQAQQAAKGAQDAANAAQSELRSANLNSAKTDLQLAVQQLNAAWSALDPQVRRDILPLQRAWWKQAVAQCKVTAAGSSTDPIEIATSEAACEAKANQDRLEWLNQHSTVPPDSGANTYQPQNYNRSKSALLG